MNEVVDVAAKSVENVKEKTVVGHMILLEGGKKNCHYCLGKGYTKYFKGVKKNKQFEMGACSCIIGKLAKIQAENDTKSIKQKIENNKLILYKEIYE